MVFSYQHFEEQLLLESLVKSCENVTLPPCAVYQQLMLRGTKDHQFWFLLNLCPSQQATKLDPMGKSHSFLSVTLNTRRRKCQYGNEY